MNVILTGVWLLLNAVGVLALIYGVFRFVQFWLEFAKGINEARGEPKGFEVTLNSGGEPETKKKENDHG